MSDMERVGGRVEPHVDPDRTRIQTVLKGLGIGGVMDQTARLKFGEQALLCHPAMLPRRPLVVATNFDRTVGS